jgi:hypothetical protein
MATLTEDELARIRAEVYDNVLDAGATVYFPVRSLYDVIRTNVVSSSVSATSSTTTVSAAGPTTLTLASVTGLTAGQKVQIDCDGLRETVTVRAISGSTISVICNKLHSGTYPVEIESPLTIVRGVLSDLALIESGAALSSLDSLGLKQVDEVVFRDDLDLTAAVEKARDVLRKRLASLCGIASILQSAKSRGATFEVY